MLIDLLIRFLKWRNRNYVPPVLTEWEQVRDAARLDSAVEGIERGDLRAALRYIRDGSRRDDTTTGK